MRHNLLIKSMIRQPLRTVLLALLIFLATFAFVLRTVEYLVVRSQIYEIAEYYRAVGDVNHPHWFGDVSAAIEIISNDPRVGFEDGRRSVEGFLADSNLRNFDVGGMETRGLVFPEVYNRQARLTETFFYAYVAEVIIHPHRAEYALRLLVDAVLVGYDEHIVAGQELIVHQSFHNSIVGALSDIQVGGRYFFRAGYFRRYPLWGEFLGPLTPRVGDVADSLTLLPLNPETPSIRDRVMFVSAPTGTEVDFGEPLLAHVPERITMLERGQRAMSVQTTRDMASMPNVDNVFALLAGGRLIDYNDYRRANPVAVVNFMFAQNRGLSVGDTITLTVPREQQYAGGLSTPGFVTPFVRVDRERPELYDDYIVLELEIVGITRFRTFHTNTIQSLFIWIPDSVLPSDIVISMEQRELIDGQWVDLPMIRFGVEHMPDSWYSFAIADSRDNAGFFEYMQERINEMGYALRMDFPDSMNFWATAEPVLLIILFNASLFWAALLAVLGLVVFLFLKQRRREFAIMRIRHADTADFAAFACNCDAV